MMADTSPRPFSEGPGLGHAEPGSGCSIHGHLTTTDHAHDRNRAADPSASPDCTTPHMPPSLGVNH